MKCLYKVVDLSHHNGAVDFCNLINKGIGGVILKCGGSETSDGHTYEDKLFQDYYTKAKLHGLRVGAYYFGVGSSIAKGNEDALRCRELLKNKQFDLPIFIDYETSKGTGSTNTKNNKKGNTDYVVSFCHTLEKFGFFVGVYASDISGFKDMLELERLYPFAWWVARYGKYPEYATRNLQLWQYTSTDDTLTLSGRCDVSECYVNYDFLRGGFNGY